MQNFAILRVQKIKEFPAMARRVRHCERAGKQLPSNVDPSRQNQNTLLFPAASGPKNAIQRWRKKVGTKKVRRNAVLAIEVLMGMSREAGLQMSPTVVKEWAEDSMEWAKRTFGGKDNIIAGGFNGDETTPHVHMIFIPLDSKGRLNCRNFLGGDVNLSDMQTSYALAVRKFGLNRGLAGSKRKYIAQKYLHKWNQNMHQNYESSVQRLNQIAFKTDGSKIFNLTILTPKLVSEIHEILRQTMVDLAYSFRLAEEVILTRRDGRERAQIIFEKEEAKKLVNDVKQQVALLKNENSDFIRGIDLVPIASEILTLNPIQENGVHVFADANISLKIEGRKFHDCKNPNCKGTGVIELVQKLTGRNFGMAVEFLLTHFTANQIVADAASITHIQHRDEIAALKPQATILRLNDIPPQIWKPVPAAWPQLLKRLVDNYQLLEQELQLLHKQNFIWATNPNTLAVSRTGKNDTAECRGVTLMDLSQPKLTPRILAAAQGGLFRLGDFSSDTVVGVANPLEALSYRNFIMLKSAREHEQHGSSKASPVPPTIISLDAELPHPKFVEQMRKMKKRFLLATNTALGKRQLAEKFPQLVDADGEFVSSFDVIEAEAELSEADRPLVWNKRLVQIKINHQELTRNQNTHHQSTQGPSR